MEVVVVLADALLLLRALLLRQRRRARGGPPHLQRLRARQLRRRRRARLCRQRRHARRGPHANSPQSHHRDSQGKTERERRDSPVPGGPGRVGKAALQRRLLRVIRFEQSAIVRAVRLRPSARPRLLGRRHRAPLPPLRRRPGAARRGPSTARRVHERRPSNQARGTASGDRRGDARRAPPRRLLAADLPRDDRNGSGSRGAPKRLPPTAPRGSQELTGWASVNWPAQLDRYPLIDVL